MSVVLFVGLGNQGEKYHNTLHNAGFIFIDAVLTELGIQANWREKYNGLYIINVVEDRKIIFVKPQTYMNNSGLCVVQFRNFYKVENDNIFVFHDDIDLELGQIKFKTSGGNGGHNGLKSLDVHIGNNYHRVRFGVGRPITKDDVASYVLSGFLPDNIQKIQEQAKNITKNIVFFLAKQFSRVKSELTK